jgi:hypothetical protein
MGNALTQDIAKRTVLEVMTGIKNPYPSVP